MKLVDIGKVHLMIALLMEEIFNFLNIEKKIIEVSKIEKFWKFKKYEKKTSKYSNNLNRPSFPFEYE